MECSVHITHKTEVGGVHLDLQNDEEIRAVHQHILASVKHHAPDAKIHGVTIQYIISSGPATPVNRHIHRNGPLHRIWQIWNAAARELDASCALSSPMAWNDPPSPLIRRDSAESRAA